VAGLTLAVFSAAIQCLGGRKAITGVVRRSTDFKSLNRKTRMKLLLQEKHSAYRCQRLLAGLRSKTEIHAMFGDENDDNPCWKDGEWETELRDYLGTPSTRQLPRSSLSCSSSILSENYLTSLIPQDSASLLLSRLVTMTVTKP
jgi:hypothetical protein